MSLWSRFTLIFKSKANKALDKMENPAETLDYSYEKQLELLTKVKRGLTDVATARKRVELQIAEQEKSCQKLTEQAQKALAMGREDLAREALTRKAAATTQIQTLREQQANLAGEEEKLTNASHQLAAKIEAFRTKKETIKATYAAAKAQVKIDESLAGLSGELTDMGLAMERAVNKTQEMQARAGAVDELLASGALEELGSAPGDNISRELNQLTASADIEAELAQLKALPATGATPAIEIGKNQQQA